MISKNAGIVIRTVKYGESSAICNILTEQYGLLGFHIPSAYKNKGPVKISYLQALNCVEISFNYRKSVNLQRLSDISCTHHPEPRSFSQQALYHITCELVQQTIRENELNPSLFMYLHNEGIPGISNAIHYWQLRFMMLKILHHYGCSPNIDSYSLDAYLDLQNGVFLTGLVPHKYMCDQACSLIIFEILTLGITHLDQNAKLRQETIDVLIRYFQLHVRSEFELKGRDILSEMMRHTPT